MTTSLRIAVALGVMLAATAPALAANETVDWSGFYAGIIGGYGKDHTAYTSSFDAGGGLIVPGPSGAFDLSGAVGGVQVGYDQQFDHVVFGIVGDIEKTNVTGDTVPDPTSVFPSHLTTTADWMGSVRARLGYVAGPVLLYGTAGVVAVHANARDTNIGGGFNVGQGSNNFYGGIAGLGAEMQIGGGFSIFAQGKYFMLNKGDIVFKPAPLTGTNSSTGSFVEVGLNKRF